MDQYNIPDAPLSQSPRGRFRSGCGCSGIVVAFFIGVVLLILAFSLLALSSTIDRFLGRFEVTCGEEEIVSSDTSKNKVVKIEVKGAISFSENKSSFWGKSEGTADVIIEDIRHAREDSNVKGLLLVVDSPGGEITACDFIDQEIKKFRASSTNRCVVSYMRGMAASGGYYVSAHADRIVITPTTITGSIGVMMQGLNFQEAAEKLGVKNMTFTSGPMKDMLNPMKGVSESVSNVVQTTIDELHGQFVNVIAEGRHMPVEKVRELADGRIYTARQSVENGLTDKIGYMEEVKETFKELGLADYELVEYEDEEGVVEMLKKAFSTFGGFKPEIKMPESSWRLRYASPFMEE